MDTTDDAKQAAIAALASELAGQNLAKRRDARGD